MFREIFKTSSDGKKEHKMYGSAHANRIATRRNELQTFLVGTTHAQGHLTFTQQVMQMPSVQVNSYNFSEVKKIKKIWLTRPASGKFDRVSRMP